LDIINNKITIRKLKVIAVQSIRPTPLQLI